MLPILNMNAQSTDVGKQITSIKSYINSLKDSIDDELSHISYEQLDANLRKKIDALNDAIKITEQKADDVAGTVKANYITANEVAANYITASQVAATYITASQVEATYATIGAVNANTARISTIESNYVGTNYLAANYATISSLNSATARIGTIESNYITANAITASAIAGKFSAPDNGLTITTESIRAANIQYYTALSGDPNPGYRNVTSRPITINGNTYNFLILT